MGGTVTFMSAIDNDYFNINDMHIMCRNIGGINIAVLHFLIHGLSLDDGLCILECDKDCWDLFEWLSFAPKRCIDIYAEQLEYTHLMVLESVLLLTNGEVENEDINVDNITNVVGEGVGGEVEDGDINVDNVANVVGEGVGSDCFFDDEYADLAGDSLYARTNPDENANTTS